MLFDFIEPEACLEDVVERDIGTSCFYVITNGLMMNPIKERTLKISIGKGIFNSAAYGPPVANPRPNKLQIPKAVPASRTGKM